VLAQDAKLQQVDGAAVLKAGQFDLNRTGTAKPQKQVVDLGLRVGYQAGKLHLGMCAKVQDSIFSGTASAEYKTRDATFGLQGNLGQKDGQLQRCSRCRSRSSNRLMLSWAHGCWTAKIPLQPEINEIHAVWLRQQMRLLPNLTDGGT
jgi:hypothetical protein